LIKKHTNLIKAPLFSFKCVDKVGAYTLYFGHIHAHGNGYYLFFEAWIEFFYLIFMPQKNYRTECCAETLYAASSFSVFISEGAFSFFACANNPRTSAFNGVDFQHLAGETPLKSNRQ